MFALLILLYFGAGGAAFGALMIVGSMLYAGKWSLPGTGQREVAQAKSRAAIAELEVEVATSRQRREVIELQADLQRAQLHAQMEAIQDANFQKALNQGEEHD